MYDYIYIKQPECPKLKIGDKVIVHDRRSSRAHQGRLIDAVVAKVGRVWLTLAESGKDPEDWRTRTWRMRRDTQQEVDSMYSGADFFDFFRTPEQEIWHTEMKALADVLRQNGISLDRESSWARDEAKYRALAAFLVDRGPLPVREPGAALAAVREHNPILLDHHSNHAF